MPVKVMIPTALRQYADGHDTVELEGDTVGDVLAALGAKHPDLKKHLFGDDGKLRNFVNVYLNDDSIRDRENEATALSAGDELTIVPAIAGGMPAQILRSRSMSRPLALTVLAAALLALFACGDSGKDKAPKDQKPAAKDHDHAHDEVALGTFDIGGLSVEAAQGHGAVEPGKEGHLVVKLPYNDGGKSIVRVWIGTEDKTKSAPGKGEYAPSHDDYDVHAVAPDPLPEGAKWWVEIEKPDGTTVVGSIPFLKDVEKNK